jgi:hypothetical protein
LGVCERFTRLDVDDPCRDANAIDDPLIAADDDETGAEIGGDLEERSVRAANRVDHAAAIDHAEPARGPQVAGDRFRDARGEPRGIGVSADVDEVEDGN